MLVNSNRRDILKLGAVRMAAPLAIPFIARSGWAKTPDFRLKMTFADTQSHPVYDVLKRFAATVGERTSGAVDIQVFSIGQLGSGTNIMTGLQTGIIDFCAHTSGFIDTTFPPFQVVDLPFLFPDSSSAERLLDGPIGQRLLDMMPAKGIYGLGFGHWGWRVVSTVDRPVPKPADIRGLKVRVQPGAIFSSTFQALGASPQAIDLSELYLALSQRVIDAVDSPVISVAATKLNEVVNTVNVTNQVYNVGVLMASKAKFDLLPRPFQDVIRHAARELTGDWRKTIAQKSSDVLHDFVNKGVKVVEVQRELYRSATAPVYQQFRGIVGADLYDAVLKEVGHA